MIIEKLLEKVLVKTPRVLRHTYTLILIVFSRGIFYYTDQDELFDFLGKLFASKKPVGPDFLTDAVGHIYWFVLVIVLCIPWNEIFSEESKINRGSAKFYNALSPAFNLMFIIVSTALLVGSSYNPFIYFRF
jgi:alginate O-acetyltransferase complex protein AlgI